MIYLTWEQVGRWQTIDIADKIDDYVLQLGRRVNIEVYGFEPNYVHQFPHLSIPDLAK